MIARADKTHHDPDACAKLLTSDGANAMAAIRQNCDALELTVADDQWPLPKYREMLFLV